MLYVHRGRYAGATMPRVCVRRVRQEVLGVARVSEHVVRKQATRRKVSAAQAKRVPAHADDSA